MTQASRERLIIFTRYPEPGTTKTRLIPVLGAQGAATLQRQMAEHTLAQVKELIASRLLSAEVHFAGGTSQLMQNWLGSDFVYRQQSEGDLGTRIISAFAAAFAAKMTSVVIIGVDCPDLSAELIIQAFEALQETDLVLGPAQDGGYYLIGLRQLIPELFTGISWSTDQVLQQTLDIAQKFELTVSRLPQLRDVDRPEDLSIWNSGRF